MIALALLLTSPAEALPSSVTLPIPDFSVHERSCAPGTGGWIPCVELYEYRVNLTNMWATLTLVDFTLGFGIAVVDLDAEIGTAINSSADPFDAYIYTSVAGILGFDQSCDGWVEEFPTTAHSRMQLIINPFTGNMRVDMPPLEADIGLESDDIQIGGWGCTVGLIDAALGAIPGLDLSLYDFVIDAVVPELEQGIADMTPAIEDAINASL